MLCVLLCHLLPFLVGTRLTTKEKLANHKKTFLKRLQFFENLNNGVEEIPVKRSPKKIKFKDLGEKLEGVINKTVVIESAKSSSEPQKIEVIETSIMSKDKPSLKRRLRKDTHYDDDSSFDRYLPEPKKSKMTYTDAVLCRLVMKMREKNRNKIPKVRDLFVKPTQKCKAYLGKAFQWNKH
ncbi:hypothetical protein SNEBB_005059 [Seison nebaliae]|nr:hypothetical protein SNEBB_005059 [Seison nebaliae]